MGKKKRIPISELEAWISSLQASIDEIHFKLKFLEPKCGSCGFGLGFNEYGLKGYCRNCGWQRKKEKKHA